MQRVALALCVTLLVVLLTPVGAQDRGMFKGPLDPGVNLHSKPEGIQRRPRERDLMAKPKLICDVEGDDYYFGHIFITNIGRGSVPEGAEISVQVSTGDTGSFILNRVLGPNGQIRFPRSDPWTHRAGESCTARARL